jgi:hypothetical protein
VRLAAGAGPFALVYAVAYLRSGFFQTLKDKEAI